MSVICVSNGHLSLAGSVGALFQPELPRVRMVGSVCRVLYLELLFSASAAHSSDWFSNGRSTHLAPAVCMGDNLPFSGFGDLRLREGAIQM